MSEGKTQKSFGKRLLQWGVHFCALSGLALSHLFARRIEADPANQSLDPDFLDWLRNDPMITGNPASRYGDDAPGYLTSNGLGSLEVGGADDRLL